MEASTAILMVNLLRVPCILRCFYFDLGGLCREGRVGWLPLVLGCRHCVYLMFY